MEWEYQIQPFGITADDDSIEDAHQMLNEMGNEEWEIFAILPWTPPSTGKRSSQDYYAVAKRPSPSFITAEKMAADAEIDPKAFRNALRDADLQWHKPHEDWKVARDSPQHKDMERVLHSLHAKLKKL